LFKTKVLGSQTVVNLKVANLIKTLQKLALIGSLTLEEVLIFSPINFSAAKDSFSEAHSPATAKLQYKVKPQRKIKSQLKTMSNKSSQFKKTLKF
jgi:hypothetical protein